MTMRLSRFWWFTEDDGEVCFGTIPDTLSGYVVATGVHSLTPIKRRLTNQESVRLRNSSDGAEDWIFTQSGSDAVISLAREVFR
jgi:hypothetical protein